MFWEYDATQEIDLNELYQVVYQTRAYNYEVLDEPILILLARYNKLEEIISLHKIGFNLNITSQNKYTYGNTVLIEASMKGHVDIVKYLIDNGVDLNKKNYMGNCALMMAVMNKQADVVKLLLENGAKVDNYDKNKITPLIIASGKGYAEIVKLLIEAGANPTHHDDDGEDALALAYRCGNFEIIDMLKN